LIVPGEVIGLSEKRLRWIPSVQPSISEESDREQSYARGDGDDLWRLESRHGSTVEIAAETHTDVRPCVWPTEIALQRTWQIETASMRLMPKLPDIAEPDNS
jgi:hypothetical protein